MVQLPPTNLNSELETPEEGGASRRPPYRPPLGFPDKKKRDLGGKIAAVLLHLLLILLLFAPLTSPELREEILGAGGAGPAGGGGGGHKGSGGGVPKTERTQFVQVAPPPKPVTPPTPPTPQIKPPEVKPIVPPPPTPPTPQKSEVKTEVAPPAAISGPPTAGTGGGTGNDGSNGTGPGSGGGKGAGVGTGTGSANGPGTGGGPGTIYPPVPTVIFMPPIPTPSKIRGFEMIAEFDVDSTGKVLSVNYNKSKDGNYNRKLEETLAGVRFRPGVNGLGQPVRAKYQIVYTF